MTSVGEDQDKRSQATHAYKDKDQTSLERGATLILGALAGVGVRPPAVEQQNIHGNISINNAVVKRKSASSLAS